MMYNPDFNQPPFSSANPVPELPATQITDLATAFRQFHSGPFPPVVENYDRGKTIFFPGDPAERVYFLLKGAVRLSRVYEAGEEITVALLRENSVFGVLSLLTGQKSDRFYHAVAFTPVELLSAPIEQVQKALNEHPELAMLMLKGLSSRILQTEMMIETLAHRDMGSRLVSFLLILCRDFGVPTDEGIRIDLKLSHQAIAEAIGSTRVTVTRLLGELREQDMISIYKKKITVHDPVNLSQQFA
ncbi:MULTISPECIES: global nitrogen regulator NtcA [Cyanophyceae]|uniref:Global nitrogen regulator n=1 Tax=Synechococcus sp. UTEX 2380 TaxID=2728098 RepID=A0A6M3QG13_9SYNE|nr:MULTISPECIES: global nitrogen regulator NtcA [Cyanophyceae]AAK49022.1 global nitrogen regulator [Picosynechococcus sp. PCC 7002]QJC58644.1 global nitrogen assimilation regulator [Synechococcus sp. UTEX 2380]SMH28364.1 CRP/FNR family transcriptional regulator, anaerobic regulatory protein [Picosynechococcus sp. OG1]